MLRWQDINISVTSFPYKSTTDTSFIMYKSKHFILAIMKGKILVINLIVTQD